MRLTSTFVALAIGAAVASAQNWVVHNNCTETLDVTIASRRSSSITVAAGATSNFTFQPTGVEFQIYTSGRAPTFEGIPWPFAAQAGFFSSPEAPNDFYYYILKDANPNNLNVGVSIAPTKPISGNLCRPATCSSGASCPGLIGPERPTYTPNQPPTALDNLCQGADYRVTLCPATGKFPEADPGTQINIKANSKKCLDIRGAVFADGTAVQIFDCNNTEAQKWVFKSGDTSVKVLGRDFCLDAGSNPGEGTKVQITRCNANSAGQKWYYAGIWPQERQLKWAGANKQLCLDLTKGDQTNSNAIQLWSCGPTLNPNQLWTTVN